MEHYRSASIMNDDLPFVSDWRSLDDAAQALGCSVSTLYRLRSDGVLKAGVHWHRISTGWRAPLRVNVASCRLALRAQCAATHDATAQSS